MDSSSIFVTVETAGATSALDHKLLGPLICIAQPLFGGVTYYLITGYVDSHHALFMLFYTHGMYCADGELKAVSNDAVRCLKRLSSSTEPLHLSPSDQRSVNYHQNQHRSRQRRAARQSTNESSRVPPTHGIATVTTGGRKPNHSNPSRVPGRLHHHPSPQSAGIPWLTPRWIKTCCSCFAQVVGLVG